MYAIERVCFVGIHYMCVRFCWPDDNVLCLFLIKIIEAVQQDTVIYVHAFETSERQVDKSVVCAQPNQMTKERANRGYINIHSVCITHWRNRSALSIAPYPAKCES